MFIIYVVLLMLSIGTFIWTFLTRYRHTGQVCSGDFIEPSYFEESDASSPIVLWEEMENEFYLINCGKLLRTFIVLESIFVFCCICSGAIWSMITPNPLTRVSTSVDEQ